MNVASRGNRRLWGTYHIHFEYWYIVSILAAYRYIAYWQYTCGILVVKYQ